MKAARRVPDATPKALSAAVLLPLILGGIVGLGTLVYSAVADALIILLAVWLIVRYRALPPWWVLIITAAIGVTGLAGVAPSITAVFAIRVLALGVAFAYTRRHAWSGSWFLAGVVGALLPQTVMLAMQGFHSFRPTALSVNASQTGETGMVLYMLGPSAWPIAGPAFVTAVITAGTSGARQVVIGVLLWAALHRRLWLDAVLIVAAFMVFAIFQRNNLGFGGIGEHIALRAQILHSMGGPVARAATFVEKFTPESWRADAYPIQKPLLDKPQQLADVLPKYPPGLHLVGFGVGAYNIATAAIRPHNIFVLEVYEMGVLAFVPLGLAVWAAWTRRLPWALLIAPGVQFLGTEEWTGRAEGYYMLAALIGWYAVLEPQRQRGESRSGEVGAERQRLVPMSPYAPDHDRQRRHQRGAREHPAEAGQSQQGRKGAGHDRVGVAAEGPAGQHRDDVKGEHAGPDSRGEGDPLP
jgi:hypothetical protein